MDLLTDITGKHPLSGEMQAYTAKSLVTDKLFYLLRAYFATDDADEKFRLMADLEGDFISVSALKGIYKRLLDEKAVFNTTFRKTKHMNDYFAAMSYLFGQLGYNGWVILFDEAELIGRLGKKARLKAYMNMASFLYPGEFSNLNATFSLFTMTSQYIEDVLDGKNERGNLADAELDPSERRAVEKTHAAIAAAPQLNPLTKDELNDVMISLLDFYKRAYDRNADVDMRQITELIDSKMYFTINRGRQYGKTTTLSQLERTLRDRYTVVSISFERPDYTAFETPAAGGGKDVPAAGGKFFLTNRQPVIIMGGRLVVRLLP